MNKPLSRRHFLKAAAVAPVAARSGALQALTAEVKGGLALAQQGVSVGLDMPVAWGVGNLVNPRIYTMWKLGMLPDWVRAEVEDNILQNYCSRLAPDIAALRSVSVSAKLRLNRDRIMSRVWSSVDELHTHQLARKTFWDSEHGADGGMQPPRPY